jgi:hypothetical protein
MPVGTIVAGVQREPEHPDPVLLARPEERRGHREVLVDAREAHRLLEGIDPFRRRRLERPLAVRDPIRVTGEHAQDLFVVQLREPRRAQRDQERGRLLSVRIVGGEQHLFGPDEPVEAEEVERAPDGRVEERACLAAEPVRQRGQVGDARMRDDQLRFGVAV